MKSKIVTPLISIFLAALLGAAACGEKTPPEIPRDATPTMVADEEYLEIFETVWQTVNDTYFDPTFGGLDWQAVHDRYEALIAAAQNDAVFYRLVNEMLWELGVSHAILIAPDNWTTLASSVFAEGSVGLEVRLLDGEAVVAWVEPDSPGDRAGIRPGFAILTIDGTPIGQIIEEATALAIPPRHARGRTYYATQLILGRLYGTPGEAVTLTYADGAGETNETTLVQAERQGKSDPWGGLPSFFLEFETKHVEGETDASRTGRGIGYIRFNPFHPGQAERVIEAIRSMDDAPGIILDLRRNQGGDPETGKAIAEQFVDEPTPAWRGVYRDETFQVVLEPGEDSYDGPLVLLVDGTICSMAEVFAPTMQAIGRAVVIGEQSAGGATGGNVKRLSNGAVLMYPVVQLTTPDGTILEGRGVVPDIEVKLDRELLLQGVDSQLEAAIAYIQRQD